jgi:urease accessory protein
MERAITVVRDFDGDAVAQVTLPFNERHRRRFRMADDQGRAFLLDLAETSRLEDGDGLVLESGGVILVRAANEDVLDIACDDSATLARIAWHLGNRHTPVQVLGSQGLRIAYDHVLEHMVQTLGAQTRRHGAPFTPENGAYAEVGHSHGHHH